MPWLLMGGSTMLSKLNALDGSAPSLDQIVNHMNGLIQAGQKSQWELGTLYNHIVDRKLAEFAGYRNSQLFFSQRIKALGQSTLSNYGTVARNFTDAQCEQFGVTNLRNLLRYVEASGIALDRTNPGPTPVEFPGDDGKVYTSPFADCTIDMLERATKAKRTPAAVRVPIPDAARLLFIEDSLLKNFTGIGQVRITSHSKEGKTFVNLSDVPMTELERLLLALREGLDAQPTLAPREKQAA